ncbi:MAG: glycosyltransferase family 2 protein [Prevotellaceae bacterium]|jgi:glycosyltransferase involved in cell wall biosynthesis|nr:glycosyltransferase family 2 protein [Prevotellaceae bacterium]
MLDLSVIILTFNEEQNIRACLQSLTWSNDIHVLDSGSTDNTITIAEEYGVKVKYNKFESFGKQRNYALEHCAIQNEWILFLDADEVATNEFVVAMEKAILESDNKTAGFYCCWKMILEDKWLKHCDNYPKWQFRLMRKGRAVFTDFGHGQKEGTVLGEIKYIKEPYLHYGFSKGWHHWIARHNRYSTLEALDRIKKCPPFKQIFSKNKSIRNIALKSWLTKFPGWPLIRFFQAYIFNLGFLEGVPGFIYCVNIAYYEFLIVIKIRESKRKKHLCENI